jgi:hypothetical protein
MKHTLFFFVLTLLFEGAFAQEKKFSDNPGVAGVQPVNKKIVTPAVTATHPVNAPAMALHAVKPMPTLDKNTAGSFTTNAHSLSSVKVSEKKNPISPAATATHPVQPLHVVASRDVVVKPAAIADKRATAMPLASAAHLAKPVPTVARKAVVSPAIAMAQPARAIPITDKKAIITPAAAVVIHPFKPLPVAIKKTPVNATVKTIARNTVPITSLDRLLKLPLLDPKYSTREYEYKLIPERVGGNLKEGDIITTEGYIQIIASEKSLIGDNNGDYQLQLTMRSQRGDSCLIVAIPYAAALKDSGYTKMRKHIREALLEGKEPSEGGNMMRNAVYVRVTGRLYYDASHAIEMRSKTPVYKGKGARLSAPIHSYTAWEIHPVSRLEFIDKN